MIKLIDILKETNSHRRAVTHQTINDPENNVYAWDVHYAPDFVKLIDNIGHSIREYTALIKNNNMQDDTTIMKNLESLKDFRINLIYLTTKKFPELAGKIKPLF